VHKNNFDFLRLVFAICVIITHSYALSGEEEFDWLYQLTAGQVKFSTLGVSGFFIISGYLIFESFTRSDTLKSYFFKRALRIYPALLVVLILTLLLGSFVTTKGLASYLYSRSFWTYVPKNLFLFANLQYSIDGVFESNPYPSAINGSLWTIPYEVFFYMVLATFFFIKHKPKAIPSCLIVLYILLLFATIYFTTNLVQYSIPRIGLELHQISRLGVFFSAGSILAAIKFKRFRYRQSLLLFSVIILGVSFILGQFLFVQYIILPIVVISIGLKSTRPFADVSTIVGDLSYGLYLYSFPVQQTLMYYFDFDSFALLCYTLPITGFMAFLSWNLIEKPALKYKLDINRRKPDLLVSD